MTQAIPYLSYDGTCAEAIRFYEKTFGGKLLMMMNGGESPMAAHIPPEHHDRIIHARLALPGGGMIYAGDCPAGMPYPGIQGVAITIDFETAAEAERVFAALAEGGTIQMPLQEQFWAERFGMVVDRFGTPWSVNGAQRDLTA